MENKYTIQVPDENLFNIDNELGFDTWKIVLHTQFTLFEQLIVRGACFLLGELIVTGFKEPSSFQ